MVICFECSRETKQLLDELVSKGGFSNHSEAIAVAVANQTLLTASVAPPPLVVGATYSDRSHDGEGERDAIFSQLAPSVPGIFRTRPKQHAEPIAPLPETSHGFSKQDHVLQANWIFGQHNKLLPVKASCRAIANLLIEAPAGVEAGDAARLVANEAGDLGGYLYAIDKKFDRQRDNTLSTAFPGRSTPDKGRIRYANQFVVGTTKQGQLTGLLVDLGLINKLSPESLKVSLTKAGWEFALMPNPILDCQEENPSTKLSPEERAFLTAHIAQNVPVERSAYLQILRAIHSGHDNPTKLSAAFNDVEKETVKNRLYFMTQRAGAISRMADLGLMVRERNGTRVSYMITESGAEFLNQ